MPNSYKQNVSIETTNTKFYVPPFKRQEMANQQENKPELVEVKHLPVEVKHLPVEVKHLPVEIKHLPVEVKHLPVEVKQLPVQSQVPFYESSKLGGLFFFGDSIWAPK